MPRKDLEEVFPAELNNRLCGFITRMLKDDLAQGKYRIGIEPTMLNHDLTSVKSANVAFNGISSKDKKKIILYDSYHMVLYDNEKDFVMNTVNEFFEKLICTAKERELELV